MSRRVLAISFTLIALASSGCQLIADFEKDRVADGGKSATAAQAGKGGAAAVGGRGGASNETGGTQSSSAGQGGALTTAGLGGASVGGSDQSTTGGVIGVGGGADIGGSHSVGGISGTGATIGGASGSGGSSVSTSVGGASSGDTTGKGGTANSSTGGVSPSTAGAGSSAVLPPTITSFSVDYNRICSGSSAKLKAVFSNGTGTIDGGVGVVTSGEEKPTGAVNVDTTYKLTVTNSAGQKQEASVAVAAQKIGAFTTIGVPSAPIHSLALLSDGRLVFSSDECSVYVYDTSTGTTSFVGSNSPCWRGYISSIGGSKVLLHEWTGPMRPSMILDLDSRKFTSTATMSIQRDASRAVELPGNGRVLFVGGEQYTALGSRDTAELFDPAQGSNGAYALITMQLPRAEHTATLLGNGKVLVTGGLKYPNGPIYASAELYDPSIGSNGAFSMTGSMSEPRSSSSAVLLADGNVLVVGGTTTPASAELYNTAAGKFSLSLGKLQYPRSFPTLVTLKNGRVLVFGGFDVHWNRQYLVESYNPLLDLFTTLDVEPKTFPYSATLLPNGIVLIAGVDGSNKPSAELFCP